MPIEAASSIRAAAADQRAADRAYRSEVATEQAYLNRDKRVEEAKAADAARPTPAERALEQPQRRSSSSIFDVVA